MPQPAIPDARVDRFAELLSQGRANKQIREELGLTIGEYASCMRRVKSELGRQAA